MNKEKIYNVLIFVIIFIAILSQILTEELGNLDEIWNYNFARNMANGLIPYKDFNMLQMPLVPFLCGITLKIVANELIIMRVMAAILCTTIIYSTYKLFILLNIKKEISIIFTFAIGFLFKDLFCIDYNYATLLLVLYIIFNEIKIYNNDNEFLKLNRKSDFLLGILAGLTITLKQTTGLFVCMAFLGNKLLFVRNKQEFKTYLKIFALRLIGILIPVITMVAYLIINGAFLEFIDYTILGVSGFSNYISYTKLFKLDLIGILSILVPLTFVLEGIKTIRNPKDKIPYIFLVYGLAMFIVCFPISDRIHFLIGALPTIIFILYESYNVYKKVYYQDITNDKLNKIMKIILIILVVIVISSAIYYSFVNYIKYYKESNYSNLEHYSYIPISPQLENQISAISNYINSSEKDVKILDASAAVYMIPINRYNKDYDLMLKGNLGTNGEKDIINEIEEGNNTIYLVQRNKAGLNWQTPMNIINYVLENKEKISQIRIFDIYE